MTNEEKITKMASYTKKPSDYIIELFYNSNLSRENFNKEYKWFCQHVEHSMELIHLLMEEIKLNKDPLTIQFSLQLIFISEISSLLMGAYFNLLEWRYSCSFSICRSILESVVRATWISYYPDEYQWVLPTLGKTTNLKTKRFNFSQFLKDQLVEIDVIFSYLSFHSHWNTVNVIAKWWNMNSFSEPIDLDKMHLEWNINTIQFLIFIILFFIKNTLYKWKIHIDNLDTTLDVFENILIKWSNFINPNNPFFGLSQQFKNLIRDKNL